VRERELYTRPELAKRSKVAIPTIEALEGGLVARPRRGTIEKLADALGVDVHALMDGPEDGAAEVADAPSGAARQRSEAAFVIVGKVGSDGQPETVLKWNVPESERPGYRAALLASLRAAGLPESAADAYREEEMSPEAAEVLMAGVI
jgi:transcriptional regulator with XRE-family HTH domain